MKAVEGVRTNRGQDVDISGHRATSHANRSSQGQQRDVMIISADRLVHSLGLERQRHTRGRGGAARAG